MQGFMRQRGHAWELHVYLGKDPFTGRKRYVTRTVRSGKRDAQRALTALVTEANNRTLARTRATFSELIEEWFALAAQDFSPSTVRETRGYVDRNILPALGSIPLSRLRSSDLDAFYRALREGTAPGSRGRLAPATIRRIHGITRRALAQGVKWGWLGSNAAAQASPPRVPKPEVAPPSAVEVARLFATAFVDDPQLATFVLLAAATGARRSELVALRWSDIDLEVGLVKIRRGIVLGPDGLVEKDTKTHSARAVALDPATRDALVAHHARMLGIATTCGAGLGPDAFVFSHTADASEPVFPDSMSRAFVRLCRRAGVEGIRLHDLRHYVATQLLSAGVDVRTVAGRLGHRNASTTLNVYGHFLAEADREAANMLGRILDAANKTSQEQP